MFRDMALPGDPTESPQYGEPPADLAASVDAEALLDLDDDQALIDPASTDPLSG